jgi:hypothetical protein
MRAAIQLALLSGAVVCDIAFAQNFSGVYVGASSVTEPDSYRFTTEGRQAQSVYDPLVGDKRQYDDCARESLPALLLADVVKTLEIQRGDDSITMRFERDDAVRTIHMDGAPLPADQLPLPLGYSTGRWDVNVLTVETTHFSAGGFMFVDRGYPFSSTARITERYWREPRDNNLQMELVVDDPVNYTEPVTLGREWIWSPDEEVHPWNCFSLGSRGSGPIDFDELKRQLGELE